MEDESITPEANKESDKYILLGVDIRESTYKALLKIYESENGRTATAEEKQEIHRAALGIFQNSRSENFDGSNYEEASSESGQNDWRERGKVLERKRIRKHKIWAVLRYMVTYQQIAQSSNFYDYKKYISDFNYAKGELKKSHPDEYSFKAAIRFCQMEFYYGTCDHQLTDEEIKYILNWQTNTIDTHEILKSVLVSYKEYWDDVLASYIRPSARIKRLQYLVDNLEDVMNLPDVQEYPDILEGVKELQSQYQLQLNEKSC